MMRLVVGGLDSNDGNGFGGGGLGRRPVCWSANSWSHKLVGAVPGLPRASSSVSSELEKLCIQNGTVSGMGIS